ncbi:hypothetical protein M378DRAFT_954561 [Amanita muscaria Koide BX008]|uniref:Uncharacterized protein n=1 Tax=Amanita muscaria (strain Koide BX008) TaxID=946122 RepID=A0A0C2WUR4_AMAMK|nr:hypothetical protein M378DRAFT_954561 [Amanita muscaria Koide BX008]
MILNENEDTAVIPLGNYIYGGHNQCDSSLPVLVQDSFFFKLLSSCTVCRDKRFQSVIRTAARRDAVMALNAQFCQSARGKSPGRNPVSVWQHLLDHEFLNNFNLLCCLWGDIGRRKSGRLAKVEHSAAFPEVCA